jgi:hypothetical protein
MRTHDFYPLMAQLMTSSTGGLPNTHGSILLFNACQLWLLNHLEVINDLLSANNGGKLFLSSVSGAVVDSLGSRPWFYVSV